MQTYVWEASGLENFVVNRRDGIGVVHTQCLRGGEHDFEFWMLLMLPFQDVDGLLRQRDSPNRRPRPLSF